MRKFSVGVIGLKGIPAKSGAERVFESIAKYLHEDFDITVYCKKGYADYTRKVRGVKRIVIPSISLRNYDMAIYFLLSALHAYLFRKYDLLHVHNIDCAYVLPILSSKYKNRILSTSHGSPYKRDKWSGIVKMLFRYMERIFFRYSDVITSVSMPLKRYYEMMYKRKVRYIPNGVNKEEKISTEIIHRFLREKKIEGDYILFAAGRIIPTKGCHILLDALRRNKYDGNVLIAGDLNQSISYARKLKRMATKNTFFLGLIEPKEELLGVIKEAKIFVFPSTYEAMSMILLEVASLGIPIIASDIAANRSVFDSDHLLYFNSGNVRDLSERIKWGLVNYDEMRNRAKSAKLHIQRCYLWCNVGLEYALEYRGLIGNYLY